MISMDELQDYVEKLKRKYALLGMTTDIDIQIDGEGKIVQRKFRTEKINYTFKDEDGFREIKTEVIYVENCVNLADFVLLEWKSKGAIIKACGGCIEKLRFTKSSEYLKLDIAHNNISKVDFSHLSNLRYIDLSGLDMSQIESFRNTFYGCMNLLYIEFGRRQLHITDLEGAFGYCVELRELDLTSFNTENLKNMGLTFEHCESLETIKGLTEFNTSHVDNMIGLFRVCSKLSELDLSSFDTSNVVNMESMFEDCTSLRKLNLNGFNTSKVARMDFMFARCKSLNELDLGCFSTSALRTMNYMFYGCYKLVKLNLASFDTSHVSEMNNLFDLCKSLEELDLRNFNFESIIEMEQMFSSCDNLKNIGIDKIEVGSKYSLGLLDRLGVLKGKVKIVRKRNKE